MANASKSRRAFTLIEILIVVAIIAILAAIAVPNFLEAQTRSKVSRVKNDLRTLATALEAYRVDYNAFPSSNRCYLSRRLPGAPDNEVILERLSTPIAYITQGILPDPFPRKEQLSADNTWTPIGIGDEGLDKYTYAAVIPADAGPNAFVELGRSATHYFIVSSAGPSRLSVPVLYDQLAWCPEILPGFYDPTNGTISVGWICRVGGCTTGGDDKPGHLFAQISTDQSR